MPVKNYVSFLWSLYVFTIAIFNADFTINMQEKL